MGAGGHVACVEVRGKLLLLFLRSNLACNFF